MLSSCCSETPSAELSRRNVACLNTFVTRSPHLRTRASSFGEPHISYRLEEVAGTTRVRPLQDRIFEWGVSSMASRPGHNDSTANNPPGRAESPSVECPNPLDHLLPASRSIAWLCCLMVQVRARFEGFDAAYPVRDETATEAWIAFANSVRSMLPSLAARYLLSLGPLRAHECTRLLKCTHIGQQVCLRNYAAMTERGRLHC